MESCAENFAPLPCLRVLNGAGVVSESELEMAISQFSLANPHRRGYGLWRFLWAYYTGASKGRADHLRMRN